MTTSTDWLDTRLSRRLLLRGSALVGTGLATAALIGCDDDEDDEGRGDGGGATATATEPGASATEAPSSGGPVSGGVFRWNTLTAASLHQDPMLAGGGGLPSWTWLSDRAVIWNAPATEMIPHMISSWETADGLTHNVTTPQDIKTHDKPLTNGRMWDAEDLALSMMRGSGLDDPEATRYRAGSFTGMVDATAVDNEHVTVTYGEPAPWFPQNLTDNLAFFIPRENFLDSAADAFQNPERMAGYGPFMTDEFREAELQRYVRNPDWSRAADDSQPYLDAIEMRQIGDRVSQVSNFLQGGAEYLENPNKVERESVLDQMPDAQLHAWAGSTVVYAKWNVTRKPFDDPRVRQALHLATNYVQNNADYWGEGFFALAGSINNAHGLAYLPEEIAQMPGWRLPKDEDIAEAQKLVDAAGFPNGAGIEVRILASEALTPYGYDFSIRQIDNWTQALPDLEASIDLAADFASTRARQNDADFDFTPFVRASASPASLDVTQHYATGAATNVGLYSDAYVDEQLEKARTTLDLEESDEIMRSLQDYLLEDMSQVITHRLYQAGIYAPSVRGLPVLEGGTVPIAGNFSSWLDVQRHNGVVWLEK